MHVVENNPNVEQKITEEDSPKIIEEFDFKLISKNDFNLIYKRVQRRRRCELEKKEWDIFLKKKIEENKKKVKNVKGLSHVVSIEECPLCIQAMQCNMLAHKKKKPVCPPVTCTSKQNDESLALSWKNISLKLPLPVNESPDTEAIQSDLNEKRKAIYPKSLEPLQNQPNTLKIDPESLDLPKELFLNGRLRENYGNILESNLDQPALEYDYKKVEELRTKMELSLRNIYKQMVQRQNLSEEEDAERIKQRSMEFSSRFKRNYLYRLQCILNDIDKRLNDRQKYLSMENLAQKVILAHQSCLQALQTIEKQLPKISVDSPFNVFNNFFMSICDLTKKFKFIFGLSSKKVVDNIIALSENIMDAMIDLIKVKPLKKRVPKERKKMKDNLWMYSNKNQWQSKAAALAKSRFELKNKQSTQNKINTSQDVIGTIDKSIELASKYSSIMILKRKSKLNVRKRDQIAEDEIKTMVEMTHLNDGDNTEVYDNLQIDVNPTLREIETAPDQFTGEQKLQHDFEQEIPQISVPDEKASETPSSIQPPKDKENYKTKPKNHEAAPKNVALYCIQRYSDESANVSEETIVSDSNESLDSSIDEEENYRNLFSKYKKESGQFDENFLGNVTRISSAILEDIVASTMQELNDAEL